MSRIISMCLDSLVAAILLIPIFFLLNKHFFQNTAKAVFYFLFSVYLCAMFAVVGLPDICYYRFHPNVNIKPFQYMFSDYLNSFLNVVLFFPLGFFLPLFWSHFRTATATVAFGFQVSFLIEFLQIFTYRATDVNDLITNTIGTLIGWIAAKLLLRLFPSIHPSENRQDVYTVCAAAFAVMYFIQPFFANYLFQYL